MRKRFSKWRLLVFTTARILQLYKRYKRARIDNNKETGIERETLEEARMLCVKDAQNKIDVKEHIKLRPKLVVGVVMVVGYGGRLWWLSVWLWW